MKTLITSALFIAQFMINGSFAQEMASATNEALAQRIAEDVREEIGLADSSAFQLVCRLTERNQGMAGTGAALVMYAPARLARNTATPAISSGSPGRPNGMRAIMPSSRPGAATMGAFIGVGKYRGANARTRM